MNDRGAPLAQWPERGADLGGKQRRFLPGSEVIAPVNLVEVDEVGVARAAQLRGAL